jgi:hypothetical protein
MPNTLSAALPLINARRQRETIYLSTPFNFNNFKSQMATMKVLLDITDSKAELAMEFLKSISFVKKVKAIAPNEITNASILQSIGAYEKGKIKPTPVNLKELKAIINA